MKKLLFSVLTFTYIASSSAAGWEDYANKYKSAYSKYSCPPILKSLNTALTNIVKNVGDHANDTTVAKSVTDLQNINNGIKWSCDPTQLQIISNSADLKHNESCVAVYDYLSALFQNGSFNTNDQTGAGLSQLAVNLNNKWDDNCQIAVTQKGDPSPFSPVVEPNPRAVARQKQRANAARAWKKHHASLHNEATDAKNTLKSHWENAKAKAKQLADQADAKARGEKNAAQAHWEKAKKVVPAKWHRLTNETAAEARHANESAKSWWENTKARARAAVRAHWHPNTTAAHEKANAAPGQIVGAEKSFLNYVVSFFSTKAQTNQASNGGNDYANQYASQWTGGNSGAGAGSNGGNDYAKQYASQWTGGNSGTGASAGAGAGGDANGAGQYSQYWNGNYSQYWGGDWSKYAGGQGQGQGQVQNTTNTTPQEQKQTPKHSHAPHAPLAPHAPHVSHTPNKARKAREVRKANRVRKPRVAKKSKVTRKGKAPRPVRAPKRARKHAI